MHRALEWMQELCMSQTCKGGQARLHTQSKAHSAPQQSTLRRSSVSWTRTLHGVTTSKPTHSFCCCCSSSSHSLPDRFDVHKVAVAAAVAGVLLILPAGRLPEVCDGRELCVDRAPCVVAALHQRHSTQTHKPQLLPCATCTTCCLVQWTARPCLSSKLIRPGPSLL